MIRLDLLNFFKVYISEPRYCGVFSITPFVSFPFSNCSPYHVSTTYVFALPLVILVSILNNNSNDNENCKDSTIDDIS